MKTNTTRTHDLDTDLPALVPEVIADQVTTDPDEANALCERARRHWRENHGFRSSFRRRDEREQLRVWMQHWHDGRRIRQAKERRLGIAP